MLFANYRISTVKSDVGFNKKVTRALGSGERVLYTAERPAFLAKNRYGLPDSLALSWAAFVDAMPTHSLERTPDHRRFWTTFDATGIEPNKPLEALPPGRYVVQIVNSEMRPTKDGTGQYLWLELDVLEGALPAASCSTASTWSMPTRPPSRSRSARCRRSAMPSARCRSTTASSCTSSR